MVQGNAAILCGPASVLADSRSIRKPILPARNEVPQHEPLPFHGSGKSGFGRERTAFTPGSRHLPQARTCSPAR